LSDPKRLFDDGADELGKALLGAGRTLDAEQARARKLAMLGAAGAAAATATAVGTKAAAKGALHLVSAAALKWLGIGLVAAAVATGGALYFARSGPEAKSPPGAAGGPALEAQNGDPSNSVISPLNTAQLTPPGGPSEPSAADTGGAPAPAGESPEDPAPRAKAAAPVREAPHAEPKPSSSPGASGESLAEEVTALKRAREALAAGRPNKALTELNIYDKRFRGGRLALEAEVLRIEALAQSGEGKAAAARAASFLSAHPSSPYANRIRAIAEGPKAE
jgi:hypothetical protein